MHWINKFFLVYGQDRVCAYDGFHYCHECHENKEHWIPAKVVFNWDFRPYKGTLSYRILRSLWYSVFHWKSVFANILKFFLLLKYFCIAVADTHRIFNICVGFHTWFISLGWNVLLSLCSEHGGEVGRTLHEPVRIYYKKNICLCIRSRKWECRLTMKLASPSSINCSFIHNIRCFSQLRVLVYFY